MSTVKEIQKVLLVDAIATVIENDYPQYASEINRPQEDLMDTVPAFLKEHGININDFLGEVDITSLIHQTNQAWKYANFTVKDLYEYDEDSCCSLFLGYTGHGVTATDEPAVYDLFKELGIEVPKLHVESFYNAAYSALATL